MFLGHHKKYKDKNLQGAMVMLEPGRHLRHEVTYWNYSHITQYWEIWMSGDIYFRMDVSSEKCIWQFWTIELLNTNVSAIVPWRKKGKHATFCLLKRCWFWGKNHNHKETLDSFEMSNKIQLKIWFKMFTLKSDA